jgi:hypothetical protein
VLLTLIPSLPLFIPLPQPQHTLHLLPIREVFASVRETEKGLPLELGGVGKRGVENGLDLADRPGGLELHCAMERKESTSQPSEVEDERDRDREREREQGKRQTSIMNSEISSSMSVGKSEATTQPERKACENFLISFRSSDESN